MSFMHISALPLSRYAPQRQSWSRAARQERAASLRSALQGAGWILVGAGIGSATVIAGAWLLVRL